VVLLRYDDGVWDVEPSAFETDCEEEPLGESVVLGIMLEEVESPPPPPLHGCVDSKSMATYRFKVDLPPQVSVLFPVHGMLQELLLSGSVPLPKTTPQ
jgi:hypothetical protein